MPAARAICRTLIRLRNLLPAGAIRTRIGLIFFSGMSVLLTCTLAAAFWMNKGAELASLQMEALGSLGEESLNWERAALVARIMLEGGELPPGTNLPAFPAESDPKAIALLQRGLSIAEEAAQAIPERQPGLTGEFNTTITELIHYLSLRRADHLGMARGLFAALFISTTAFLLVGLWFTEELVAKPLEELIQVTSRIAAGDLDTPVRLRESHDYQEVARSFEEMRLELRAARERSANYTRELEERVTRRTRQLTALARVVAASGSAENLTDMLHTALDQALQTVGVERGGLWLADENNERLIMTVAFGLSEDFRRAITTIMPGEGATGQALVTGKVVVIEDATQEPERIKQAAVQEGIYSLAAVPLEAHETLVGVLDVMTTQKRIFTPEELTILTALGQQIGIGVENARLIAEIRRQTEQVAVLQERGWIGAGLHDGLLQTLGYLYLKADQLEAQSLHEGLPEMARQLAHQREVLEKASIEIRRFISELRETSSPSRSLRASLQEMIDTVWPEDGIEIAFTIPEAAADIRLEADKAAHVTRIAREALLNAVRHGQARHAWLACNISENGLELTVRDDGVGFRPENPSQESREHFGLSIMRARAARVGGDLTIQSSPGQGTLVTLTWPLEKPA
jgi:two-component system nitrate/nitrite sensor histidine kinase NarX